MRRRHRPGFGIGDVDDVVLVDEDTARPAELMPLCDEGAILFENLNAIVAAITQEQAPPRIHRERVRPVHLAGTGTLLAPGLEEFPVLVEFHDACIGVAAM